MFIFRLQGAMLPSAPLNEDQAYYKRAGNGPDVAKEKETEALKEKAMSELALSSHQKRSTRL